MANTLDPKLDVVFKALLSGPEHQSLLTSLLTAVLRPSSPIVKVELLDPALSGEMVDDKNIVLDILVRLQDGRLINVEMHMYIRPGHRRRSLMYLSRTYAGQLERGQGYDEICAVVGVHLVATHLLPGARFHSIFRMLEVTDHELYTDAMELHVVELSKLPSCLEETSDEDALARWGRFLMAETDEQRSLAVRGDAVMEKAKAELERLSEDPAVQEVARRRELAQQLNRIELAMVRKEGREEGREEGHEAGRVETFRQSLRGVLQARNLQLKPEHADTIAHCSDPEKLEAWLVKAASAHSLDEVFGD